MVAVLDDEDPFDESWHFDHSSVTRGRAAAPMTPAAAGLSTRRRPERAVVVSAEAWTNEATSAAGGAVQQPEE